MLGPSLHKSVQLLMDQKILSLTGIVFFVSAVPAAPVNISVTQLRAHSAMVTWNVPQGDRVIGYAISQQVQELFINSHSMSPLRKI